MTLAEVVMGEYSVACFDEISNGLDSAATFDMCVSLPLCVLACDVVAATTSMPGLLLLWCCTCMSSRVRTP